MSSPGTYGPARCTGWALAGPGEAANAPSTRPTAVRRSAARLHRSVGHEFTRATVCLPDCSAGRSRGPRGPGGARPRARAGGTARRLRTGVRAESRPHGNRSRPRKWPRKFAASITFDRRVRDARPWPGESLSPESERRSAVLPAAPKVAPLVPRTENLMTKRLLVTAVVSLGATALTFAPSTQLGGLAGVAPARAATSAAAVPADADSGMDDSAVGALDQAGLGGPVDAAGAAPADGPIDADAPADPAPADAAAADPAPGAPG